MSRYDPTSMPADLREYMQNHDDEDAASLAYDRDRADRFDDHAPPWLSRLNDRELEEAFRVLSEAAVTPAPRSVNHG